MKISTPYMKSGVLWEDFRAAFGKDDPDRLVWRAPSVLMNPTLAAERLERERRLDPDRYAREYLAEFAEDLEALFPGAWVDQAVVPGRHELPPREGVICGAGTDPMGGGPDDWTLSVLHAEGHGPDRRVVQDLMRGWGRRRSATVDLEGVVKEIAGILRAYRLTSVMGDRYAAGWVRQAFQRESIRYVEAPEKALAYLEMEPYFAQGRIEILDHPRLIRELKVLERRPRAGGKVVVDHPAHGHDDYSNSLALSVAALGPALPADIWAGAPPVPVDPHVAEVNRQIRLQEAMHRMTARTRAWARDRGLD